MSERDWRTPLTIEELLAENGAEPARIQAAVNRGHGGGISPEDEVLPPVKAVVETADKADDSTEATT